MISKTNQDEIDYLIQLAETYGYKMIGESRSMDDAAPALQELREAIESLVERIS